MSRAMQIMRRKMRTDPEVEMDGLLVVVSWGMQGQEMHGMHGLLVGGWVGEGGGFRSWSF